MDVSLIEPLTQFINGVGFPIAAFAAMFWMCNKTIAEVKDAIDNLSTQIEILKDITNEKKAG